MGRFLFILIGFLLMGGATIGGLYYWGIDPLAKLGLPSLVHMPTVKLPTAPQGPAYVDFGLLVVPIIDGHDVKGQADFIVRLEVYPDMKEKVAAELPRLQAGYLEDLIGVMPQVIRGDNAIDTETVRRRLFNVSQQLLGTGMIKAVVIEQAGLQ